jgi:hypothetical protein
MKKKQQEVEERAKQQAQDQLSAYDKLFQGKDSWFDYT